VSRAAQCIEFGKLSNNGCYGIRPDRAATLRAQIGARSRAEVLGGQSFEVWALCLSGGPVRDVLTTDPGSVATREDVFAVPLDVIGNLARKLSEVYEQQRGATL
jgi:hypothetical protein